MQWNQEVSLELPYPQVNHVQVSGDTVVFAHPESGDLPSAVGVVDMGDPTTATTVARSQWPGGLIDWVEVQGDTVVYLDQDRIVGTDALASQWRLWALDLGQGTRSLLASSGASERPWVPVPNAGPDGFVWVEWLSDSKPEQGQRIRWWQPGWGAPRTLTEGVFVDEATLTATDGMWVYSARSGGIVDGMSAHDVFVRPLAGGKARQLTDTGVVTTFDLSDDQLVWAQRAVPGETKQKYSDPYSHWALTLPDPTDPAKDDRAEPFRFQVGFSASNVVAGQGFAAWWPRSTRTVALARTTGDGAVEPVNLGDLSVSIPARLDADGTRLVFATNSPGQHTRIHVLRVTPLPSE